MSVRIPRMAIVVAASALVGASPASAAGTGQGVPMGGTITVTGTDGKDELFVELDGNALTFTVTPAANVTATSGTCPPNTDPLTGRPTVSVCRLDNSGVHNLVINARGGDDSVRVRDANGGASSIALAAGTGNDFADVSTRAGRTLRGEDGNDTLVATGRVSASTNAPVSFDGGAGMDTAAWTAMQVDTQFEQVVGITASLATNTAAVSGLNSSIQPATFRTDTLTAIESLSGTEVGDVLTGNSAANTLAGNSGNDNLSGGDGPDALFGGDGLDSVDGGKDSDTMDGGLGVDLYPPGAGGDTYNVRDGYQEEITCVSKDIIVDDLADKVLNSTTTTACTVSTAAAKHQFDTKLSGRPAKISAGMLVTKVRCPVEKPETCQGRLEALLGKTLLSHADYKVQPGHAEKVRLPLAKTAPSRAAGKRIVLSAKETDADGRDRFVSRPTRVKKL